MNRIQRNVFENLQALEDTLNKTNEVNKKYESILNMLIANGINNINNKCYFDKCVNCTNISSIIKNNDDESDDDNEDKKLDFHCSTCLKMYCYDCSNVETCMVCDVEFCNNCLKENNQYTCLTCEDNFVICDKCVKETGNDESMFENCSKCMYSKIVEDKKNENKLLRQYDDTVLMTI